MIITAGRYKGRRIITPDEKITRPTLSKVRMGVFNSLYSIIGNFNGLSFLDVFGGSGIIGLEALSRGFGSSTVFEKNKHAAEVIKQNYKSLGLEPDLHVGDSLMLLDKLNKNFDVIYIDPPYHSDFYEEIILKIHSGTVIVEHSETIDFSGLKVIKQKQYSDKYITFLRQN